MKKLAFGSAREEENFGIVLVVPKKVEAPKTGFVKHIENEFINVAVAEFDSLSENLPNFIEESRMGPFDNAAKSLVNRVHDRSGVVPWHEELRGKPIELIVWKSVVKYIYHHRVNVLGLLLPEGRGTHGKCVGMHVKFDACIQFLIPAV